MKIRGAATATFLIVLLVAVLPFFFSGGVPISSPFQVSVASANEPVVQEAGVSSFNLTGTNLLATVQTQVSVNVQPSRVALGSDVLVKVAVSPLPPTATDFFSNLSVLILCPDGTAELLGPFLTDANGLHSFSFKPEMIGSYRIQASCGEQFFPSRNITYSGAERSEVSLTVLSDLTPDEEVSPNASRVSGWQASSKLVEGLPPLGMVGENSQCLVFNLGGNGRWDLIIGPYNGWTPNEYPFTGYYWDGSQWVNDNTTVNGLAAHPGLNHPTVGFNVTGDNTFDMIVGGNPYMSSPGWSGYFLEWRSLGGKPSPPEWLAKLRIGKQLRSHRLQPVR